MSKYAIYYIIDNTLIPSIDWFFSLSMTNHDFLFHHYVSAMLPELDIDGDVYSEEKYRYRDRFTLQNPFTILFDGEPFMKITDPQHIARITELLLTQN